MANAFTVTKQWRTGGPQGKSFIIVDGILVIDTTASGGAAPDDLPASLFKLTKIVAALSIINDGETFVYPGSPDYTGDSLMIGGGVAGAVQDLPNDTYRVRLMGT